MPIDIEAAAQLIDLAGAPSFGTHLLEMAAHHAGIEEIFGYVLDSSGAHPLVSASALDHQNLRVEAYARRFFRQDPAVNLTTGRGVDANFAQIVLAEEIIPHDYRKVCFDAPRFAGKLCFGWRSADHTLLLNFYRRNESPDAGRDKLGTIASLALTALHRRLKGRNRNKDVIATIETRMLSEFPLLSGRERQVVGRTLVGHSAEEIGAELGMARSTVLTHRQRAYQKYGVSSAGAFVPRLL